VPCFGVRFIPLQSIVVMCCMFNKVLLGNLSTKTTEKDILELFTETLGTVLTVDMPLDPKTGNNRGYAFVVMGNEGEAVKAVSDLDGKSLTGRNVALSLTVQLKDQSIKPKSQWYKFGRA
jgi:RNA recognition motif-containing protein